MKDVLFEKSKKSESAAEYRKETEGKGNHLPTQARAKRREKRTGPRKEDGERRDEKSEARAEDLRCLTVSESSSGEGTLRCQRRGGPKRYEPRRKPRGTGSANRESRGRPETDESMRRGKTEPTAWGDAEAGKQVGHKRGKPETAEGSGVKRGERETEGSAVSKGSESGTESRIVGRSFGRPGWRRKPERESGEAGRDAGWVHSRAGTKGTESGRRNEPPETRARDERHGRLVRRKRRKEPTREARREERPGRLGGRDVGKKKVRGQSESDARVPVRAEEMKRSLRLGWVKTRTGERDGGKPKGEA